MSQTLGAAGRIAAKLAEQGAGQQHTQGSNGIWVMPFRTDAIRGAGRCWARHRHGATPSATILRLAAGFAGRRDALAFSGQQQSGAIEIQKNSTISAPCARAWCSRYATGRCRLVPGATVLALMPIDYPPIGKNNRLLGGRYLLYSTVVVEIRGQ